MSSLKYSLGLLAIAGASFAHAATSQLDYVSTNNLFLGFNNVALSPGPSSPTIGNPTSTGDGALIQIGYFSTSTDTFTGTWVPITGAGSANTLLLTSVGDGGDASSAGIFSGSVVFDNALAASSSNLPPAGTQLAIRVFNGTTEATSTHYNTVTSTEWNFVALATPGPLPEALDLDTSVIKWQDAGNAFKTSIAIIPEPSTAILGAIGALGLLRRRR